jgi:hypothetical protein
MPIYDMGKPVIPQSENDKKCKSCETVKPKTEFYYHNGKFKSNCKICYSLKIQTAKREKVKK